MEVVTKTVVGILVPILITDDVQDILGDCVTCNNPIPTLQIAILNWKSDDLIHFNCVPRYIEKYLASNPDTTILELQVIFGISRATAYRRLKGARSNGSRQIQKRSY